MYIHFNADLKKILIPFAFYYKNPNFICLTVQRLCLSQSYFLSQFLALYCVSESVMTEMDCLNPQTIHKIKFCVK